MDLSRRGAQISTRAALDIRFIPPTRVRSQLNRLRIAGAVTVSGAQRGRVGFMHTRRTGSRFSRLGRRERCACALISSLPSATLRGAQEGESEGEERQCKHPRTASPPPRDVHPRIPAEKPRHPTFCHPTFSKQARLARHGPICIKREV